MLKIEVSDITLETDLCGFSYESNIIPNRNDIISIKNITYIIIDIVHRLDSDVNVTLLVQPVIIKYGEYLH